MAKDIGLILMVTIIWAWEVCGNYRLDCRLHLSGLDMMLPNERLLFHIGHVRVCWFYCEFGKDCEASSLCFLFPFFEFSPAKSDLDFGFWETRAQWILFKVTYQKPKHVVSWVLQKWHRSNESQNPQRFQTNTTKFEEMFSMSFKVEQKRSDRTSFLA